MHWCSGSEQNCSSSAWEAEPGPSFSPSGGLLSSVLGFGWLSSGLVGSVSSGLASGSVSSGLVSGSVSSCSGSGVGVDFEGGGGEGVDSVGGGAGVVFALVVFELVAAQPDRANAPIAAAKTLQVRK